MLTEERKILIACQVNGNNSVEENKEYEEYLSQLRLINDILRTIFVTKFSVSRTEGY